MSATPETKESDEAGAGGVKSQALKPTPERASSQGEPIYDVDPLAASAADVPAWSESCLVSVAPVGKAELFVSALSRNINIEIGNKPVEFVPNLFGGRFPKFGPMDKSTVTIPIVPVQAGTATWPASVDKDADGIVDIFAGSEGTTQPLSYSIDSITRQRVRLTILWTEKPYSSLTPSNSAAGLVQSNYEAYRISFADGYMTAAPHQFTDDLLEVPAVFEFGCTDKDGTSCILVESTDGTTDLTALADYTNSTKFR